jgi:hypothetical protein
MAKVIKILEVMELIEKRYNKGKIPDRKFSQYATTCGLWIKEQEKFPFGTMTFTTKL